MNSAVLLKISLMLGILVTLLLTPAFAQWVYYEFDTAPSVQKQYPIQMEEFNYEQTVTLPGAPGTTTPEETTPDPEGPEETTPDPEGPEDTEEPEQTTPQPETPPSVPDGENHYNMVVVLTGKTFEEVKAEYPDMDEEKLRGFYNAINLNVSSSITFKEVFGKDYNEPFHSEYSNTSGSNYQQLLQNFDAELLSFAIVRVDEQTLHVYSYTRQSKAGTVEVYRTTVNYNSTSDKWETDLFSVVIGTATVEKKQGRYVIDIESFE